MRATVSKILVLGFATAARAGEPAPVVRPPVPPPR